jgi:hypothetical protein
LGGLGLGGSGFGETSFVVFGSGGSSLGGFGVLKVPTSYVVQPQINGSSLIVEHPKNPAFVIKDGFVPLGPSGMEIEVGW